MAVVEELLRAEDGGAISFGNHKLGERQNWKILSVTGICGR